MEFPQTLSLTALFVIKGMGEGALCGYLSVSCIFKVHYCILQKKKKDPKFQIRFENFVSFVQS